jgi:hypothetical protein
MKAPDPDTDIAIYEQARHILADAKAKLLALDTPYFDTDFLPTILAEALDDMLPADWSVAETVNEFFHEWEIDEKASRADDRRDARAYE